MKPFLRILSKHSLPALCFFFLFLIPGQATITAQTSCAPGSVKLNLYTGYGNAYTVTSGTVDNPMRSVGFPDGTQYANLRSNATPANRGVLTISLTETVPVGDTITFIASCEDVNTTTFNVSVSFDGTVYSPVVAFTRTGTTMSSSSYPVNLAAGARYIRFANTSATKATRLDAISYSHYECWPYCIPAVISYVSGNATVALPTSTSGSSTSATGGPNRAGATIDGGASQELFLDMGIQVPYGSYIPVYIANESGTAATFEVSGSTVSTTLYTDPASYSSTVARDYYQPFYYRVTQYNGIRFLKIRITNGQRGRVDAVSYKIPVFFGINAISGSLFLDANANLIKDGVETGSAGVTVNLFQDVNSDGALDVDDILLESDITTAGGGYYFASSTPFIDFLVTTTAGTLPLGMVLNTPNLLAVPFTSINQGDCGNDFGYVACAGACAPVAENDYATTFQGQSVVVNALDNDYDPNNDINVASILITRDPSNGSVVYDLTGEVVYSSNGTFVGLDTFSYRICDGSSLCDTATVIVKTMAFTDDPCTAAPRNHYYYVTAPEQDIRSALLETDAGTCATAISDSVRSIISMKVPYTGTIIFYDHWEDGYEATLEFPVQATTQVWGDGDLYNGIAPGYPNDTLPIGASIVLDNTMRVNPSRNPAQIYFDGRDKIFSSALLAVSRIAMDANRKGLETYSVDMYDASKFGTAFIMPLGENITLTRDFQYTALFIRASNDLTDVQVDKNADGVVDLEFNLNEGESYYVQGGIYAGAAVVSNKPIGVDLYFGDTVSCFNSKELSVLPSSLYYSSYYTPVPTTSASDSAVVMLFNPLSRDITINWQTISSSGSFTLAQQSSYRFRMPFGSGAKFSSADGSSFVANELVDAWNPSATQNGADYDWAFNLLPESYMTNYASVAWAPGSWDLTVNGNPVWVTVAAPTTIYVKYDGDLSNGTTFSPCGYAYNASFPMNALEFRKLFDAADRDQSGLGVYTCNNVKLAAAYGEDPSASGTALPFLDVGTSVQPICLDRLVFATDDYAFTPVDKPVTIQVAANDNGYHTLPNLESVSTLGLLQPTHGTLIVNENGTISYIPDSAYAGLDTFEYRICSVDFGNICDVATVVINVSGCPKNLVLVSGQIYNDKNKDSLYNDGGEGRANVKVRLYLDTDCNAAVGVTDELLDSVVTDATGAYSFDVYPERYVLDDFNGKDGIPSTCETGNDGNVNWVGGWVDVDATLGLCTAATVANEDVETVLDKGDFALRIKDLNRSVRRSVNLTGAQSVFLSFKYRKSRTNITAGENLLVQAALTSGGVYTTIYTIAGNATANVNYVDVNNLTIPPALYGPGTTIRFLTNAAMDDNDSIFIDSVMVSYLKYPVCLITRVDTTTKPAGTYMTTPIQSAVTLNSSGCSSPYNFGIANRSITVSGTLYADANGLVDLLVNGSTIDMPDAVRIYAYLVDTNGVIVLKDTLNNGNGTFSFTRADINTRYAVRLSTVSEIVGNTAPDATLPGAWVSVGENYGTNNSSGTGNESGLPNSQINVHTGVVNITGIRFGIERTPTATDTSRTYANPGGTVQVIVPQLSGTDPEDGALGNGSNVTISNLPLNANLYYNGVAVTEGQYIPAFDSTLFTVDPLFDDDGDVEFNFTVKDAANQSDTTAAFVRLHFNAPMLVVCSTASNNACFGAQNGKGYVTVSRGLPPYTYLWSNGQTTDTATGLAAGTHQVVVTDNRGTKDSCQVTITEPADSVDAFATTDLSNCADVNGYIALLRATDPAPSSGLWSKISGPGTIISPTALNTQLTGLSTTGVTTNVKWVVTDKWGCKDSAGVTVTPPVVDPNNVSKYDTAFCLTCPVKNGDLYYFYDLNGKLLAAVEDIDDAIDLGQTDFCARLTYPLPGDPAVGDVPLVPSDYGTVQPYLPRYWSVNSEQAGDMDVRLFFTDEEIAALMGYAGGTVFNFSSVNALMITAYANAGAGFVTPGDPGGISIAPTFLRVGTYWQVTFTVPSSSTFYLHPVAFGNAPLPIELVSFTATPLKSTIMLDWVTASEFNSERFEVERSLDGISFIKIGQVEAAGYSNISRSYNLEDKYVTPGIFYYYRLKQIDFDNKFEYSKIVSARLGEVAPAIQIGEFIPNPSRSFTKVEVIVPEPMTISFRLLGIDGQTNLLESYTLEKGINTLNYDISRISAGTYIGQFIAAEGAIVRKLIKIE